MRRFWRIYRTFLTSSLARELEFRANFFAKIAQNGVWVTFFVLILLVIYSRTKTVAGWSQGDAMILASSCFLMNAIVMAFTMSLMEIPEQVRLGTLDFVLTKPIDTQFWISCRKFNFDQIGTLLVGVALVVIGVVQNHASPSPLAWLGFLSLLGSSVLIFYAFNLTLMTLGIWWVKVDNLWVLSESVVQVARFPIDIYGSTMKRLFLYAVPLGFLATVPTRQLTVGFDGVMVLLGITWSIVAMVVSRLFWRFALRSYASASS